MVFSFTITISKPDIEDDFVSDLVYSSGCDDALFSVSQGVYQIQFDREANSYQEAVDSAIDNISAARIGSTIVSVLPLE